MPRGTGLVRQGGSLLGSRLSSDNVLHVVVFGGLYRFKRSAIGGGSVEEVRHRFFAWGLSHVEYHAYYGLFQDTHGCRVSSRVSSFKS